MHGYFEVMCRLARGNYDDIALPLFGRDLDIAQACASSVEPRHRFVLAWGGGNYLLLDALSWWEGAGEEGVTRRARNNDLPNARFVKENSRPADIVWLG